MSVCAQTNVLQFLQLGILLLFIRHGGLNLPTREELPENSLFEPAGAKKASTFKSFLDTDEGQVHKGQLQVLKPSHAAFQSEPSLQELNFNV